jgi:ribosomal protein S12 methylthiotransferase
MLGQLAADGVGVTLDPASADVLIVNTCSFIEAARRESEEAIRDALRAKRAGRLRGVVVAGCHAQRLGLRLQREFPEVDAVLGVSAFAQVADACRAVLDGRPVGKPRILNPSRIEVRDDARLRLTRPHTAYLRISEGCDHTCAFCVIPRFRGRYRSKPVEQVLREARELAASGAVELNVIGQDTTYWGTDLFGAPSLERLLREIDGVAGVRWIRLLYAYPACVTEGLLSALASLPRVVPYVDMPLQHLDDDVLRAMRREGDWAWIERTVARMREAIPGLVLRTTMLVGFPGETEERFERLLARLSALRFERLGCFVYSEEEGTPGPRAPGAVSPAVRRARHDRVMRLQQQIAFDWTRAQAGREVELLVDAPGPRRGTFVARSAADAPQVDGHVVLHSASPLAPGTFTRARVTGAAGYDLEAEALP